MSAYIEPIGWSDLTSEKKSRLVNSLSTVGLLSGPESKQSNELLDTMRQEGPDSLVYFQAHFELAQRDLVEVAKGVETRAQGAVLVQTFGDELSAHLPSPKRGLDNSGLSR